MYIYKQTIESLYRHALEEKCSTCENEALVVYSGEKTGRCPNDKRIVDDPSLKRIWWKKNNKLTKNDYNIILKSAKDLVSSYKNNEQKNIYIIDGYASWDIRYLVKIRVYCFTAYHALFMKNLLVPFDGQFKEKEIDFTIYNCGIYNLSDYVDNLKDTKLKNTVVALNLLKRSMVLYGTKYAGEMKKGILTYMMYLMPTFKHLPLHSSAVIDENNDVSMFFGLSGTGKTTLSAHEKFKLIGDDEHVWTDSGIFNIEGGCYAKCIRLNPKREPFIYNAIKFGSVLENVVVNKNIIDFDDDSITQNTRCCYPLSHIENCVIPAIGTHPKHIFFLTCDATGVFPPLSKLTIQQATEFFINGYTSKTPGTEMGIDKPTPIFSACFAEPFIVWKPRKYACLLKDKLREHKTHVWLINTGWFPNNSCNSKRIPLEVTRELIDCVIESKGIFKNDKLDFTLLDKSTNWSKLPLYDFYVPKKINGIESSYIEIPKKKK